MEIRAGIYSSKMMETMYIPDCLDAAKTLYYLNAMLMA